MKTPIYFDYSSTTPVDPRVAELMMRYLTNDGVFGNPASRSHSFGWDAEEAVENAREEVAKTINADAREIIWTSGATEADNLAIRGSALFNKSRGNHLITVTTEHKAVLDTMRSLERDGFEVTYLDVDSDGMIDPAKFTAALRDDTILASVMWVNNEIGVIQPIAELAQICRERKIVFHVDAAQAVGKIPMDVTAAGVDLMSLSAHKCYGPKGIGALYVRRKPRVRLQAQIHGGGHERGMRSGTLPTHQIVGMGEAFRLARENQQAEWDKAAALRQLLLDGINDIEEVYINGSMENRVPHNINISFNFVEGESLLMAIKEVAVSSGSACTSASLEPSYVLRALGRNDELAHSSIRFSIGRFTTEDEIAFLIDLLRARISKLRDLSPLWEMHKEGIDLNTVQWTAH